MARLMSQVKGGYYAAAHKSRRGRHTAISPKEMLA